MTSKEALDRHPAPPGIRHFFGKIANTGTQTKVRIQRSYSPFGTFG
jgi:hypothetical protein